MKITVETEKTDSGTTLKDFPIGKFFRFCDKTTDWDAVMCLRIASGYICFEHGNLPFATNVNDFNARRQVVETHGCITIEG